MRSISAYFIPFSRMGINLEYRAVQAQEVTIQCTYTYTYGVCTYQGVGRGPPCRWPGLPESTKTHKPPETQLHWHPVSAATCTMWGGGRGEGEEVMALCGYSSTERSSTSHAHTQCTDSPSAVMAFIAGHGMLAMLCTPQLHLSSDCYCIL